MPYLKHLPLEENSAGAARSKTAATRTWHVGKWHLGGEPYWPENHGFDVNVGGCDWGMPAQRLLQPVETSPTLTDGPEGEYLTDRLTDEAIELIDGQRRCARSS